MRSSDHEASGEGSLPEFRDAGVGKAEHRARYYLVLPHVRGRRVLDVGCGVGSGSQLLLDAGAADVTGVDVDARAVADAAARAPAVRFTVGDFTDLGFRDAAYDVVVCFAALAHVLHPSACLDELVRVLHPEGVLFVSAPNAEVCSGANPFQVHEMTPTELHGELSKRRVHTTLLRQHRLTSSLVLPDELPPAHGPMDLDVVARSVVPLRPGHDPYSVVVATDGPLPTVRGVAVVAPSDALADIERLAEALTEERAALRREHADLDAARRALSERHAEDQARLAEADAHLQRLASERDGALAELAARREPVQADAREDLRRVVAERDRYAADLVLSEQRLTQARRALERRDEEARAHEVARLELERSRDDALTELAATRDTLSWHLTRPLRAVRRSSNLVRRLVGR